VKAFGSSLQGLLLPSERHKRLPGLVNTEPVVGAHLPRAQKLQWFLSESDWDEGKVQAERLRLLREDATTAPNAQGVLVIDETLDRKDGHKTAHVGRQYLGNLGKVDNGVVSVTSLWADEQVYYPLETEPYTQDELLCQRPERSGLSHEAQNRLAARPEGEAAAMAVPCGGGGLHLRRGSHLERGAACAHGALCDGTQAVAQRARIQRTWRGPCKRWPRRRAGKVPSTPASGSPSPEPSVMEAPNSGGPWRSRPDPMGQTRRNERW
jgi:hypothetical protein